MELGKVDCVNIADDYVSEGKVLVGKDSKSFAPAAFLTMKETNKQECKTVHSFQINKQLVNTVRCYIVL